MMVSYVGGFTICVYGGFYFRNVAETKLTD